MSKPSVIAEQQPHDRSPATSQRTVNERGAHTATPGPWSFRNVAGAGLEILAPVSRVEGVELPRGMPEVIKVFDLASPQVVMIACERWVQFEPVGWHAMQVANARLIAAAPDMLAALEPFADIDGEGDEDFPDDTKVIISFGRSTHYAVKLGDFRRARAAIAKASEA